MKLLSLLASALLTASSVAPAEAGSTAAQVAFTEGVLAFDEGAHEEAARLFAEAVENDPYQATFLHWLGLAELRLGQTAEAVSHLEQSLKARCSPAAGRKRVKEDLRRAREGLAAGTGTPLKVEAPDYRPERLCLPETPLWDGQIALASGWDSNPELVTEERPSLPGETLLGDVSSDAAAWLDVAAGFHPLSGHQGWSLGLGLSGHQSKYREADALALTFGEAVASLSWGDDPRGALDGPLGVLPVPAGSGRAALLVQAGGSRAWLSGDLYRDTVDFSASLFLHETAATSTRIGVSWSDRDFPEEEGTALLRPSGEELAGSLDQWIFLGRPDRSLRLGIAAGRYDADRTFERTFRELSAAATLPLASRWTLALTGEVRDDDYEHQESSLLGYPFAPPRQDTSWSASATVLWRAGPRLSWNLRASHARRASNVEIAPFGTPLLDYERTSASLGAQWHF